MCDLSVIFFSSEEVFKEMVLFKTNYICSSQSSELPEDEQLSCGTTVHCVRRKWFMAHWNHWIKSGRVCLDFLLYDVYLLGKK